MSNESSDPMSENPQLGRLTDLHVAEYQALETRLTNWITLQCSLWAIIVVYFALVVQAWGDFPMKSALVWMSVLVLEVAAVYWYVWQTEIYNNVRYIETVLRPTLRGIVQTNEFWKYEYFISRERGEGFLWWEWLHCVHPLVAILLGTVASRRAGWGTSAWVGLIVTALIYTFLLYLAITMVRTRREMLVYASE
jgi:hypothetical protein